MMLFAAMLAPLLRYAIASHMASREAIYVLPAFHDEIYPFHCGPHTHLGTEIALMAHLVTCVAQPTIICRFRLSGSR
uniref:Putative secreted protein n=1 Tax=Anopheles darlingi TaxID=43151 RepID=A0A2M4DDL7_ANODA